MWTKKITLKYPLKIGDKEIVEIQFRKPKAKDIRRMKLSDEQEMDEILKIAGSISDLPHENNIYELDLEDASEVIAIVTGFLTSGLKTGASSSEL